jgi:hypothetical protein
MVRLALTTLIAISLLAGCDNKKAEQSKQPEEPATAKQAAEEPEEKPEQNEEKAEAPDDAGGQWVASEAYGVRFRVPEDWNVKKDGDSVSVTSPDGTISVLLVGTESEGLISAALDSIKEKVAFTDVKLEKDSQTVVNGLPGYTAQGSAVFVKEGGNQEIQFLMNSVQAGDKGVALMIFAEAEMYEARKEEVDGIAKTLALPKP